MTTPTRERKTLMGYPVLSLHHGTYWKLDLDENTYLEAPGSWDQAKPELERQLREYQNSELARIFNEEEEDTKRCCKCSCKKGSRKRENAPGVVLIPDTGNVSSFKRQATEGQMLSGEMLFNYLEEHMGPDCYGRKIQIHIRGGGILKPTEFWVDDGVIHIEGEVSK